MTTKDVYAFLKNREEKLSVLATATKDGQPECAVVGYAITDDGMFLFNANKHTRKITNIRENTSVAITVGWSFGERNVQCEGVAEIIEPMHADFAACDTLFFSTNPKAGQFKSPDTILIRVKPTWFRMIDLTVSPPRVEEIVV